MSNMVINEKNTLPIIIAISGASGTVYALRILRFLLENNYNVELVISENACKVALSELNLEISLNIEFQKKQVLSYLKLSSERGRLLNVWDLKDVSASISSGSYKTLGMIVIPCSMGTIGAISNGLSNNLITRAADVCLKERRKLVIVPREMPFSTIHLENLLKLSKMGVIVAPASPAFYHNPKNLTESVDFVVGKVLDLFGIEHNLFNRWKKENNLSMSYESIKI